MEPHVDTTLHNFMQVAHWSVMVERCLLVCKLEAPTPVPVVVVAHSDRPHD